MDIKTKKLLKSTVGLLAVLLIDLILVAIPIFLALWLYKRGWSN